MKFRAKVEVIREASDYSVHTEAVELLKDTSGYEWDDDGETIVMEGGMNKWAGFEDDLSYVTQHETNVKIYLQVDDGIDTYWYEAARGTVEELDYNPFEQ